MGVGDETQVANRTSGRADGAVTDLKVNWDSGRSGGSGISVSLGQPEGNGDTGSGSGVAWNPDEDGEYQKPYVIDS